MAQNELGLLFVLILLVVIGVVLIAIAKIESGGSGKAKRFLRKIGML